MADTEQVAVIRDKGVTEWNRWREAHRDVIADLSGADLSGDHLDGADLSGRTLPGAKLTGAGLHGGYLSRANFPEADLNGANPRRGEP
jgi:uncharacterized protein YjbI with pentapeptide repeats